MLLLLLLHSITIFGLLFQFAIVRFLLNAHLRHEESFFSLISKLEHSFYNCLKIRFHFEIKNQFFPKNKNDLFEVLAINLLTEHRKYCLLNLKGYIINMFWAATSRRMNNKTKKLIASNHVFGMIQVLILRIFCENTKSYTHCNGISSPFVQHTLIFRSPQRIFH